MSNALNTHENSNEQDNIHWSFWVGVSFFVAVIISIIWGAWLLVDRMSAQESLPVTVLSIDGEMPYTNKRDIELAISTLNLGNFFTVEVDTVQQKVANLPWVYSVSVRKKWPNELTIYVVDQTPVARWNGDFFINTDGQAFQAEIARVKHALPAFFGPEGSELLALDNFINLNNLLSFSDLNIDELVLSERFSWQLTLNDGVMLNLGRENRVERIQRFMDSYPQILKNSNNDQQVNYVDLRYDTGLSVGWKLAVKKERV